MAKEIEQAWKSCSRVISGVMLLVWMYLHSLECRIGEMMTRKSAPSHIASTITVLGELSLYVPARRSAADRD